MSYILPIIHAVSRYFLLINCVILEKQFIFHIFIALSSFFSQILSQVVAFFCYIIAYILTFTFENSHIFKLFPEISTPGFIIIVTKCVIFCHS